MTEVTQSGTELTLRPEEELVPYDHWLSWLKNLALDCIRKAHLPLRAWWKYTATEFWMVLIAHALLNISLDDAANRLNKLVWLQYNAYRRHKAMARLLQRSPKRRERKCPNGDQVRVYRNRLPQWVVKCLNRFIFEQQLDYALAHKLITKHVNLLADNTDQWYYGGERYPSNPFITAGYNGSGTKYKRKNLALMLKCGTTYLYVGCTLVKKGAFNVPDFLATADWLLARGFKIRHLLADRWFPPTSSSPSFQHSTAQHITSLTSGRTRSGPRCSAPSRRTSRKGARASTSSAFDSRGTGHLLWAGARASMDHLRKWPGAQVARYPPRLPVGQGIPRGLRETGHAHPH